MVQRYQDYQHYFHNYFTSLPRHMERQKGCNAHIILAGEWQKTQVRRYDKAKKVHGRTTDAWEA